MLLYLIKKGLVTNLENLRCLRRPRRRYLQVHLPKLSDSSGQHEYRQHHACHSEPFDRLRTGSAKNLLGGAAF